VIQRLREAPGDFAFFQAVRLLEAARREADGARPSEAESAEAAESTRSAESPEAVRFHGRPSLGFPVCEVLAVEPRASRGAARFDVSVDLLGLVGVLGTLPQHYTELVLERLRLGDRTLLDFLDLFQHRALAFFYRSWRKYRFPFELEARGNDCRDAFTRAVLALAGFAHEGTRARLAAAGGSLVFLAGHLGHRPRSAIGLEGLLGEYFGVPCRVEQLVGHWLEVPERDRSRLAGDAALGSFFVGGRTWDVGSKVRVRFGSVDAAHLRLFLPGQPAHARLCDLLWCYLGPGKDCDLVLEPAEGAAPRPRLGGGDAQLGRNSWLPSRSGRVDPATFSLSRAPEPATNRSTSWEPST
jgi:type VI secretion system protein ImpH